METSSLIIRNSWNSSPNLISYLGLEMNSCNFDHHVERYDFF